MRRLAVFVLMSATLSLMAGEVVEGKLTKQVLATGSRRVFIMSPQGETLWQHKAGNVHDVWQLPNGNIMFADGNVKEVTREGKVVFEYKPENQKGGGAYSCQRLPKGITLIGENSTGRVLEVNLKGKILVEVQTQFKTGNKHHHMRMVRKLSNGNYLVCHSGDNLVREYSREGKIVWEKKAKALAFAAVRLKNGNTIISSLNQITEYDKNGNEVWEFKASDLADVKVQNMTGFQVLPNGNLVIGCYSAYRNGGEAGIFEITRKKKLVWRYSNPKADAANMGVQVLYKSKQPVLR